LIGSTVPWAFMQQEIATILGEDIPPVPKAAVGASGPTMSMNGTSAGLSPKASGPNSANTKKELNVNVKASSGSPAASGTSSSGSSGAAVGTP